MASHVCAIRNGMSSCNEADLSNIAVAFITSAGGVVGTSDYQVSALGSPAMFVQVNLGRAYIPNLSVAPPMMYAAYLDTQTSGSGGTNTSNVAIASNTSGSTQQDYIVLYANLSASPDAAADNVMAFADVRGTGGSAPTNGQILTAIGASNPYIVLAQIAVANNATSITSGNITDLRNFASFTTGQTVPVGLYEEFTDQGSAPSAPATGKTRMFTQSGGVFTRVNGGTPVQIGSTTTVANGNSGTSFTVDWSKGNTQTFTMNNNCTFTFSNPTTGVHLTLILTEDATGSRTITWPGTVKWPNGVAPTTSGANKVDLVGFIWDGTNYYGFSSLTY